MWTIISDYTTQFGTCSASAWGSHISPYCEADMTPMYAQFGIKILAAILLTLMFQSLKTRMNNGGMVK
ncbi:MAG: hypothetical protein IT258_03785 [Saprospiraceae bacterium]|nr:hypothetical protein [Saprospiraceae bacterium]